LVVTASISCIYYPFLIGSQQLFKSCIYIHRGGYYFFLPRILLQLAFRGLALWRDFEEVLLFGGKKMRFVLRRKLWTETFMSHYSHNSLLM